jgi:uncharacterized protein RhaS with RHS repeats
LIRQLAARWIPLFAAVGRLAGGTRARDADDKTAGLFYTARGLYYQTNQLGFTNWPILDDASRKTAETNANGGVTQFGFDPAGDLLTVTDSKTNVTTWRFDHYARATNKVDAARAVIIRHSYDADDRLSNRWLTASGNTGYSYDPAGNLMNIAYPDLCVRFKYDALNRRTTAWTYLGGDLLATEKEPFSSDPITYAYTNRLRASLVLTQPTGFWTSLYAREAEGWLSSIASLAGTFTYHYKAAGLGC